LHVLTNLKPERAGDPLRRHHHERGEPQGSSGGRAKHLIDLNKAVLEPAAPPAVRRNTRDFLVMVAAALLTLAAAAHFEAAERLIEAEEWAKAALGFDIPFGEIPLALSITAAGLAWYAYRRRRDLWGEIARHKQTAAAMRAAKHEAEAASRIKSEFLAHMSHELRTPLNAIIGFSEVIRDGVMGGPIDERYRDYARDIQGAGVDLLELINGLLDLSKIEAGHLALNEAAVDVNGVIRSCARLTAGRAERAQVRIALDLAAAPPLIQADELRLKQIVLNLLSNAVKFTPAGGRVAVSSSLAADGGLEIVVRDTGIGMKPEDVPTALEPFRQLEGALSRRYEGTGLGLPLADTLTRLHGGVLEIESAPEEGTSVRVRLPAERVLAPARAMSGASL
jgi:signal transduction histidine kinase